MDGCRTAVFFFVPRGKLTYDLAGPTSPRSPYLRRGMQPRPLAERSSGLHLDDGSNVWAHGHTAGKLAVATCYNRAAAMCEGKAEENMDLIAP